MADSECRAVSRDLMTSCLMMQKKKLLRNLKTFWGQTTSQLLDWSKTAGPSERSAVWELRICLSSEQDRTGSDPPLWNPPPQTQTAGGEFQTSIRGQSLTLDQFHLQEQKQTRRSVFLLLLPSVNSATLSSTAHKHFLSSSSVIDHFKCAHRCHYLIVWLSLSSIFTDEFDECPLLETRQTLSNSQSSK